MTHKQLDGCNTQVKSLQDAEAELQRQLAAVQGDLRHPVLVGRERRHRQQQDVVLLEIGGEVNGRCGFADAAFNAAYRNDHGSQIFTIV